MRFFLRYLSLEGKKSLIAARKSTVKFIVMLLLIAGGVLAVSLVVRPEACSALRSFSKEKRSFGEQKNHLLCGWWKLL